MNFLYRLLGLGQILTKSHAASKNPFFYQLLVSLKVLRNHPKKNELTSTQQHLPWGKRELIHPQPQYPEPISSGSWPVPSLYPHLPSSVVHLEKKENWDNVVYLVCRYLGQILLLSPLKALEAALAPIPLKVIPDRHLETLINEGVLGQFVEQELDSKDREDFYPILNEMRSEGKTESMAVIDFSGPSEVETIKGQHLSSIKALLEKNEGRFRLKAIWVDGAGRTSQSSPSLWKAAKTEFMRAFLVHMVSIGHSKLHLPFDAFAAITKTVFPRHHLLSQLLRPHFRFTLGLHKALMYHRRSAAINSQQEIYTPLIYDDHGIRKLFALGINGHPTNRTYKPFQFSPPHFQEKLTFDTYRKQWFELYHRFCRKVAIELDPTDPLFILWAGEVKKHIPSFPDREELSDPDVLARTLAFYICSVSVFHTADHHTFYKIPIEYMPWRLVYTNGKMTACREGFFRQLLFQEMFIRPVIITNLHRLRYGFKSTRLQQAQRELKERMKILDRRWRPYGFPVSKRIAASLQY